MMVWEVVTPAVLSRDPKLQNVHDSEPQGEHRGKLRADDSVITDTKLLKGHSSYIAWNRRDGFKI